MREFIKKNFAILLAFILPVALIVIVALSTYLPSFFLSTDYNFIYTSCTDGTNHHPYRCDNYLQKLHSVVDNKIIVNLIDPAQDSDNDGIPDINENYTARIFLHDTKKNESREIALEEAQTLTLQSLLTSPDGVTVSSSYDRGADFFLIFDGSSSYDYYLTKGKIKDKLNLINRDGRYYYRDNFRFIGWILPGRK
jgi:phenylalanyl-tRNA synthetase beta subunit